MLGLIEEQQHLVVMEKVKQKVNNTNRKQYTKYKA